ncbi:long-chain-fatty-acid--CoA ligase [Streptomyces caniscabiei]|uniref:long-chain-fatty-acid--CoA ligase n=1 Tax=Streptomyces caniscabiei TaxID=2746961 RepID=UPI0029B9C92A|nr:long-chain-fatty-acid--CoA ligase [Streptomyces caniscabiei]MDX2606341.1 long-chain-fatty-acid--CoA ligase [Streptomyces caniscabiei]MDX2740037.1 long-chain-fatty-acid--CoA ligase [Streptomyces caniscabiei]MDX2781704.1 long-chain-fatty-acid--CoA ligase [Streptomyces caniscabiei]
MESTRRTVAQLVADRWGDHRPGLWFEEQVLTHHEVAAGAAARAALLADLLPPEAHPHLGVLLDNTPEFPLWLSAAALAGAAVAGVNPTRRGPELARDILHTECRVLITEEAHLPLLDGLELPGVRVLVTGTQPYADLLAPYADAVPDPTRATPADRLLLYFTSGSTGAPKAAICSQGRLAAAGRALVDRFGVRRDDVHYVCMPMFHGNAVIADWAPALVAGAGVALRRRFSASAFLDDVRAYRATYFTYVGRAVQYLLATEPRPDDRDTPLRMGFGTEAGAVDAAAFEERFGVRLVEGYGSSEGGAAIQRTPGAPPGAIGRAAPGDDLAVVDPETRKECPPAAFGEDGRLLNGTEAIGELVNRGPNPFEGYWRNPEADAARRRDGWYWTGDLFYRDTDGFLYFAGRTDDRLRVDSENLAAAVIENILARYEGAEAVAVYAVPDPVAGDQVMATVAGTFDPCRFAEFLLAQPDLGTKMTPRFVRVVPSMPVTATNKIQRAALRREGFRCADPVWWRPPGKWAYRKFSAVDLARLVTEYRARGREELLTR